MLKIFWDYNDFFPFISLPSKPFMHNLSLPLQVQGLLVYQRRKFMKLQPWICSVGTEDVAQLVLFPEHASKPWDPDTSTPAPNNLALWRKTVVSVLGKKRQEDQEFYEGSPHLVNLRPTCCKWLCLRTKTSNIFWYWINCQLPAAQCGCCVLLRVLNIKCS